MTDSFRSHCFVLTVSILALVKTSGNHLFNALFSDYPLHFLFQLFSFKFLLRKYKKYILTPFGRTKTKLDNKRKSTHPSLDGCYLCVSSLLSLQESFMSAEYFFVRFPYSAIITRGLDPCNKEGKHLLLERHFSFVILNSSFVNMSLV